jgi:Flp pilus assembly protein TadG
MNIADVGRWMAARVRLLSSDESSGQALIEFALISPLILMLAVGMAVFGIGLNEDLVLTNATEVGAQQLSISRGQTTDPCLTLNNAVVNAAPNLTPSKLTFNVTLDGVSATAFSGQSASSGAAICASMQSDMVEGSNESITVTYPYTASFINWGTKSYTLTASVQEVIE